MLANDEISKIGSNYYVLEFKSDDTVHYTELRDKLYSLGKKLKHVDLRYWRAGCEIRLRVNLCISMIMITIYLSCIQVI